MSYIYYDIAGLLTRRAVSFNVEVTNKFVSPKLRQFNFAK